MKRGRATTGASFYRRQVESAISRSRGRDAGTELIESLSRLIAQGEDAAAQSDYGQAVLIYETIVRTLMAQATRYSGPYTALQTIFHHCVEALSACLQGERQDQRTRKKALWMLFTCYRYDIDMGNIGMASDVPSHIVEQAQPEERRIVAQWVRGCLKPYQTWEVAYRNQWYGEWLLQLEGEFLSDEQYLLTCRQSRTLALAVECRLQRGNIQGAEQELTTAYSHELLALVDLFSRYDHEHIVVRLLEQRASTTADMRVLDWLANYYRGQHDYEQALRYALVSFRKRPLLEGYRKLRQLAKKVETWLEVRQEEIAYLEGINDQPLLIFIALDEKDVERALSVFAKLEGGERYQHYYERGSIIVAVARACEEERPPQAIALYREYVAQLIQSRGRENYHEASKHLLTVRRLYQHLEGGSSEWEAYIGALQQQHRRLRALKDELAKAALIS